MYLECDKISEWMAECCIREAGPSYATKSAGAMVWMFVSSPNPCVETLIPKVIVLRDRPFER